jgi:hypothetical protein
MWTPMRAIAGWPVNAQVGTCRNALVASTALIQRRRDREDAEEFLRTLNQAEPQPGEVRRNLAPGTARIRAMERAVWASDVDLVGHAPPVAPGMRTGVTSSSAAASRANDLSWARSGW